MLHVELAAPLAEGVIARPDAARDFMQHIRHLADPTGRAEIRAVVGVPQTPASRLASPSGAPLQGIFSHILLSRSRSLRPSATATIRGSSSRAMWIRW
jgi:rod shape-determining protein MreB and related proteins